MGFPPSIRASGICLGRHAESRFVMTFPQHLFGLSLQLTNPLLGDPQFVAELGEGRGLLVDAEAVAPNEHVPLAFGYIPVRA